MFSECKIDRWSMSLMVNQAISPGCLSGNKEYINFSGCSLLLLDMGRVKELISTRMKCL